MMRQPCTDIPRDTPMTHSVHVVRRQTDLYLVVFIKVRLEPGRRRRSHLCLRGQHHDSGMTLSQTNLVLGTDHPMTLHSPDLRYLQGDRIALYRVNRRTRKCYDHLLTCPYIRRAADDG